MYSYLSLTTTNTSAWMSSLRAGIWISSGSGSLAGKNIAFQVLSGPALLSTGGSGSGSTGPEWR